MAKELPEFLMYGVPDCPFCEEAMQLMLEHCRENNIRFTAHIQDWDNHTIQKAREVWQHKTVPIIIRNKDLLGGCTEFKNYLTELKQSDKVVV